MKIASCWVCRKGRPCYDCFRRAYRSHMRRLDSSDPAPDWIRLPPTFPTDVEHRSATGYKAGGGTWVRRGG